MACQNTLKRWLRQAHSSAAMYADFAYSLDDYDYDLPPELIAQEPAPARDGSRLLVLNTCGAGPEHRRFHEDRKSTRRTPVTFKSRMPSSA